jgi:hypothetical protein
MCAQGDTMNRRQRPALLMMDMAGDYFDDAKNLPATPLARKIIDPINNLLRET